MFKLIIILFWYPIKIIFYITLYIMKYASLFCICLINLIIYFFSNLVNKLVYIKFTNKKNHNIFHSNKIKEKNIDKEIKYNSKEKLENLIEEKNSAKLINDEKSELKAINEKINEKIILNNMQEKLIYDTNKILYNITNILIENSDEDYPNNLLEFITKHATALSLKLLIIDTKRLTFTDFNYSKIAYKLCPDIYDFEKIDTALSNMIVEVDNRYEKLLENKKKNIEQYNENNDINSNMKYIIIFINDLYDVIHSKESNEKIQYLILKGHKVGINFIMFSNVKEKYLKLGIIRGSINVFNQQDSFKCIEEKISPLKKYDTKEITELNNKIKNFYCNYEIVNKKFDNMISNNDDNYYDSNYEDPLYNEIVDYVAQTGKISASLIQKKFRLNYNRAARIIDLLEERGVIGPQNGSKPREVLIK